MSTLVDSPTAIAADGMACGGAAAGGHCDAAPRAAAASAGAAPAAAPAEQREDVYNAEYNQFMVRPALLPCRGPSAPLLATLDAQNKKQPPLGCSPPHQVCGSLFECPSKYAPIKPIGRGAYGVVW
jgi:hypothetical protein